MNVLCGATGYRTASFLLDAERLDIEGQAVCGYAPSHGTVWLERSGAPIRIQSEISNPRSSTTTSSIQSYIHAFGF